MATTDLSEWANSFSSPDFVWYAKRLSGNDTLANGSHQAGPYIPKEVLFQVVPALNRPRERNPDVRLDLYIDSHADHRRIRAVWYNSKLHDKPINGRNEARLTNLGGSSSALLDPDSTGALAIFAFSPSRPNAPVECHAWVSRHETEEELFEDRLGPVEPGRWMAWSPGQPRLPIFDAVPRPAASCWLTPDQMPSEWRGGFPTGREIIEKAVELSSHSSLDPDVRLLRRRECEFEIFRSVEEAIELPEVRRGFSNLDEFISRAQTILQRRKTRSGNSLELHTRAILLEEGLSEGTDFEHKPESEVGKEPDFLFPCGALYRDPAFPATRLRMLAVKTTCKDRWRQVLNEADRIDRKHLLTLQEGVSEAQFREMSMARVQLVVPAPLADRFPESVRPHLQTLESFIGDVRLLNA